MELSSLRLVALAILPATLLLSGCKDDSTRAEWTAKISTGPYIEYAEFHGDTVVAPLISKLANGYHVISGSVSNEQFDSTRLDEKGNVISNPGKIGDSDQVMQTTRSGLVISECCRDGAQTTTARATDGTVIWSREIVPGMQANSVSDTTDFIHASHLSSADNNVQQMLLTGIDAIGQVRWQRIIPDAGGVQDGEGGFCYTAGDNGRQFLSCVDADGADTFRRDTGLRWVDNLSVKGNRVAATGRLETGYQLAIFDRSGVPLGSFDIEGASSAQAYYYQHEVNQLVIGADQRVHAALLSYSSDSILTDGMVVEVFSASATGELSSTVLPRIYFYPGAFTSAGLLATDAKGTLYATGSETGSTVFGKSTLATWRPVIYRIDAGSAKTVIKGRKTSHSPYDPANAYCQWMGQECGKVSNLQVFSSIKALDDGAIMIGWSNATWRAIAADFGFTSSIITPADFHVSKFPAKNLIQ